MAKSVTIDNVTLTVVSDFEFTVRIPGARLKRFKGEAAWMDAERYASDHVKWPHSFIGLS